MDHGNHSKRPLVNDGRGRDSDDCDEDEQYGNVAPRKKCRLNASGTSGSNETFAVGTESSSTSNIIWSSNKFSPVIHNFIEEQSGIRANINLSWDYLKYFQLFVSEELVEFIVTKTNNYWRHKYNSNFLGGTELGELYSFIAVSLLMTRNKKLSIEEYWSKNTLLRSDIFGQVMSRDRYKLLLRMLHFADSRGHDSDRLWRIREVMNIIRKSFSDSFYPYQNLCINESLLLYKGRLSFKELIPFSRNKFRIKSFILCDCETGYIQDFIVYGGADTISHLYTDIGIPGNIVMTLLKPYLGKGHTLYVDDRYTSPALFNILHKNATNACGFVKGKSKGLPRIQGKLKEGEASFRSTSNLLAIKWKDKKNVYMITTMHTEDFVCVPRRCKKEEVVQRPACVYDYNNCMTAVDKTSMVISTIESMRVSTKWSKRYFFHIIDMCLWNAYCLYKLQTGANLSMAKFHLKLIDEILKKYQKPTTQHSTTSGDNNSLRLIGRHFPTPYESAGKNKLRRCVVCSKNDKRRESRYQCEECDVGLCVAPCFKIYHTKTYY